MNNRTLEIAALLLVAWAILQYDRDEARHRVVVSAPAFSHLDWAGADPDAVRGDDEFDRDDVNVDVEVDEPSLRMRLAEARRSTREERLRLRSEIRRQLDQARQEAWRAQAQWPAEYGDFRDSRARIREEIKREIRKNLRGSRDHFRDQVRELRNQAHALRNEARQSVRDTVRIHHDDGITVKMNDDD